MRFSGPPSGGPFRVRVRRGAGRAAPVRRVFLAGAAARGGFFPPERRKFAIGERFWGFAARDGGFGGKSRGRATSQGRGEARNAVEGGKTVRQAHVFADKRRSLCVKPPLTEAGTARQARPRRCFGKPCPSDGEGPSEAPDQGKLGSIFGKPEFAPIFFQQRKPNAKKPRTMPQKAFGTIRGLRSSLSESYSAVSSEASASSTASESAATSAVSTSVASAASASSATAASFSPPTITFTVVLISR